PRFTGPASFASKSMQA
ncbi:MAG: hypothetical protein AMXMBFR75_08580, partial [Candidatus Hinthialibacteria bacterium]